MKEQISGCLGSGAIGEKRAEVDREGQGLLKLIKLFTSKICIPIFYMNHIKYFFHLAVQQRLAHCKSIISSVVSGSLWPHGLQCTRPPCPSPTPRAYSNCPLSWWCHLTISSSVVPFSSHLQSFPASGSFQMSQFFASGGQNIAVSASASVLPMNIQDWFPSG